MFVMGHLRDGAQYNVVNLAVHLFVGTLLFEHKIPAKVSACLSVIGEGVFSQQ